MPSSQRPDHFGKSSSVLVGGNLPQCSPFCTEGDLHVSFNVEYPKTLTSKQKAAIREALQSGKRTANY